MNNELFMVNTVGIIPFLQHSGLAEETILPGSTSAAPAFHFILLRPLQLLHTVTGVQDGHARGLCHHAVYQHAARTHPSKGKALFPNS